MKTPVRRKQLVEQFSIGKRALKVLAAANIRTASNTARVGWLFTFAAGVCNLVLMRNLLEAVA